MGNQKMDKIQQFKTRFEGRALNYEERGPARIYIGIKPADIYDAVEILFNELDFRWIVSTALDSRASMEMLYHFSDDAAGKTLTLRVFLEDRNKPSVKSITPLIIGAEWIEREIHELYGVVFEGHPNLKHLLLGEDWPEGSYPMRNDQNRDNIRKDR
jgi:Ni,Fe-hydrogenase III component G